MNITNRIKEYLIIVTSLSLGIDQLVTFKIFGNIDFSVQIIALIISNVAIVIGFIIIGRIPWNFNVVLLILLILAWFLFEGLRSVQELRSITYIMLLILCCIVYLRMSSGFTAEIISRVNRKVYYYGSIIYLITFVDYIYILLTRAQEIILHRELWDVGSTDVYEVQFGTIIAFQGYSGDPNSVGIGVAVVLFCGLSFKFRKYDIIRHIINFLLILIILASNSRGAMLALLSAFLFGAIILKQKVYRSYLATAIFSLLTLLIFHPVVDGLSNPIDKLMRGAMSRFNQWDSVFESFATNPLLGNGLRHSEYLLGKYPENSYLTLMNDTGIIGLLLYLFIILVPVILYLVTRKYRLPELMSVTPWFVYSIFLVISMGYISMELKPIIWVTAGIITSALFYSYGGSHSRKKSFSY